MNSRERVLASINHKIPDRIPVHTISIDNPKPFLEHLGLENYEALLKYLNIDVRSVSPISKNPLINDCIISPFGTSGGFSDYSANTFKRPFDKAETIKEIENYIWPDVEEWDFNGFRIMMEKYESPYAIMASSWNPIFDQILDLFGMENALVNMCINPELIEAAVAYVEDYYLKYYSKLFDALSGKVQIFNMGDDFATQRGMLLSPEIWRRMFKPTYKKIFEIAKAHNLYVWFHSCGAISEVLPDLIDIGMDVWETVQAHLPGNEPERIKREYGKDIAFFGAINTQTTMPFGTPNDVRQEVRERVYILGKDGGYICGPDHHIKEDVPIENFLALYDEIINFREVGYTL